MSGREAYVFFCGVPPRKTELAMRLTLDIFKLFGPWLLLILCVPKPLLLGCYIRAVLEVLFVL